MKIEHTYREKWPGKVVQRSFIKEHSFPNGLYFDRRSVKEEVFASIVGAKSGGASCPLAPSLLRRPCCVSLILVKKTRTKAKTTTALRKKRPVIKPM